MAGRLSRRPDGRYRIPRDAHRREWIAHENIFYGTTQREAPWPRRMRPQND